MNNYFYPYTPSRQIGNKSVYDYNTGRTIRAMTAYPIDDQDDYQYAPDSI